jgi:hypothetical protein
MATAKISDNHVFLTVDVRGRNLQMGMSLQRHKYDYCGSAESAPLNSLIYASVPDGDLVEDAVEVGRQIERVLGKAKVPYTALFGKTFTTESRRVYLVDNKDLKPSGWPDHFFVAGGPAVWAEMSQDEFVAACALRRLEEAIAVRTARGDKRNYRDPDAVFALSRERGGAGNKVVAAYRAAKPLFNKVPHAYAELAAVSGRVDLVDAVRRFG